MVAVFEPGVYKTEPRPYQHAIVEASKFSPVVALFLEQGLGKTKIALDTAAHQFREKGVTGLVVVSRTAVVENWKYGEIDTHLGVPYSVTLYSTKSKNRVMRISNFSSDCLNILLINDGCLRTPAGYAYIESFMSTYKCGLMVDESTLIKNPAAILTKKLFKLREKAEYVRILSGEPAPQGPVDYYSQYKFLDSRILGVKTFTAFKHTFCSQKEVWVNGRCILTPTREFKPGMQAIFEQLIAPHTVRLKKSDVLTQLPDKQYITRKYIMPKTIQIMYQKLQDEFFTELALADHTKSLTATLAVSRAIRLHQLVSGTFVSDDGEKTPVDSGRLEVLEDILDGRPEGSKTIIWAHYRSDIDTVNDFLQKRKPGQSVRVYGGVGENERQAALARFKNDPTCTELVANPASAGWGLTLTEADTAVYYSNSYNWEHRVQSEDRIHRIGQESDSVTYYDLVAINTIDDKILEVLKSKEEFSKSVMKELSRVFAPRQGVIL